MASPVFILDLGTTRISIMINYITPTTLSFQSLKHNATLAYLYSNDLIKMHPIVLSHRYSMQTSTATMENSVEIP